MYYGEGVFLGYRYYEKLQNDPLFYFGYGLSYTTFDYPDLRVPATVELHDVSAGSFEVEVDVRNTSHRDSYKIVQLYISDVDCAALRARKELTGFAKVWVAEGETKTVKIKLDKYALSYWNEEAGKWRAEEGLFKVILS
ncbi:fibronectin type III-like domain-containing protein [Ilyonectria sp. MPI-CAGE-AT-0026]|nr:fibronectin type III-like domain-containing protein [Ilyonectria sp. MPI-CAGE-AT-0026]